MNALTSGYEVGESSTAARPTRGLRADYGFIGTLDAKTRRQRAEEVGYGIMDVWVDPTEVVEEVAPTTLEGDRQTQLSQRVDVLIKDRQFHQETVILIEHEALVSREAWAHSVGLSSAVHQEPHALGLTSRFRIIGQLSAALGQIQALQARDPTHADDPEGADSSSTVVGFVLLFLVSDNHNNMPPKRTSAAAMAAAAPMTAVAVEQLIKARVSTALANHETLRNSINGHDDGSYNSHTRIRGTVRTPHGVSAVENQVKFATYTFLGNALTWWNSHMKTVTQDVAYAMDWKALKKMMTIKYCPWGEIKKMFHEESDEVEKYVGGLPDMIQGNVMSYQPKTMEKAIEFANDQMDQKVLTIAERQAEQKRKLEFNAGNNQGCNKCKKIGHLDRDCRSSGPNGNNNNRRNSRTTQNAGTCYECGVKGHFKRDFLKLKNRNHGNQGGNGNAPAKVYMVGNAGTNPDSNVVTGMFLLNNRYDSILFDTGADRSFVSTTFSSLIDITPTILDHYYDVELADEKIIRINTIIRGCTLNFLDHPFNINLMPIGLGSFDIIICMDWLAKYHAVIDCAEKIVRIP
ncbi:reverse transcriptase domain-containing protein [Tanacetum coccineum]